MGWWIHVGFGSRTIDAMSYIAITTLSFISEIFIAFLSTLHSSRYLSHDILEPGVFVPGYPCQRKRARRASGHNRGTQPSRCAPPPCRVGRTPLTPTPLLQPPFGVRSQSLETSMLFAGPKICALTRLSFSRSHTKNFTPLWMSSATGKSGCIEAII